ncbi:helix-turn-helix transcriptional regulator [Actinomycetospora termitidis]|uniref:AraC family transcriptional regulator n=1 Tax=Actinomycetospora termitidis TaxID=3053470 RepID=A0ABT7M4L1_9PSEU|nr:AraC family transcriptional regulator [Actinomycetospora sp. Odt1-22]MDL5155611.1 AraC family transcriptional regulator [Actinomycetospora sp. Odt1-22]
MRAAPASHAVGEHQPGRRVASSADLDWAAPLVQVVDQPAAAAEFETTPTPDLGVVMVLRGTFRLESRTRGRWRSARYRPGVVGVTAPDRRDVLRWRDSEGGPRTTLHVHVPVELLEEIREGLPRRASTRPVADLDVLALVDPVVSATLGTLDTALRRGAGSVVAESLAQALGAQLLLGSSGDARDVGPPGRLSARTLGRVVDHLHAHLGERVTLDDMARQANLSRFHFLRLFAATTGTTPHRYLTDLRMERAAEMLRSGRYGVAAVAASCGYASTSRFTAVFRERYGCTPGTFAGS